MMALRARLMMRRAACESMKSVRGTRITTMLIGCVQATVDTEASTPAGDQPRLRSASLMVFVVGMTIL
jgi:hypothetical protein